MIFNKIIKIIILFINKKLIDNQAKLGGDPGFNSAIEDLAKMNLHNENAKNKEINQNEVQTISEELLCSICISNKKNILFQPCNHLSCCEFCAKDLVTKNGLCPICRIQIINSIKIFIV